MYFNNLIFPLHHYTGSVDYAEILSESVSLSPIQNVSCINITVHNDYTIEDVEFFYVIFESNDEAVYFTNNITSVIIQDQTIG